MIILRKLKKLFKILEANLHQKLNKIGKRPVLMIVFKIYNTKRSLGIKQKWCFDFHIFLFHNKYFERKIIL